MYTQKPDYPIEGVHFNIDRKNEKTITNSESIETETEKQQEDKPKKTKK